MKPSGLPAAIALLAAALPALTIAQPAPAVPMHVESWSSGARDEGRLDARLDYPFAVVRRALRDPTAWCAILSLHQNVKACVHRQGANGGLLRLYNGRKFYQALRQALQSDYVLTSDDVGTDHCVVSLASTDGDGPHLAIDLRADGADGTAIHLNYRYQLSRLARAGLRVYFATDGRGKTGFSMIEQPAQGRSVPVAGLRGLIERNAVRYHLAIAAYLDRPGEDTSGVELSRAGHWYDLTTQYPQLHELERGDYLANKRREFARQHRLQIDFERRDATP